MESCSLEVWLEADQDTGTELIQIMQERIEEECPQLTVMVKVFEADEYAGQLEQALKLTVPYIDTKRLRQAASRKCFVPTGSRQRITAKSCPG